jgi:hypothetical protein
VSCDKKPTEYKEKERNTTIKKVEKNNIFIDGLSQKISFDDYHINSHINQLDLSDFDFYGEFYKEDGLKIYRLKNHYKLKELDYMYSFYLYFIDGQLVKKQAFLFEDYAKVLVKDFGSAKLILRDEQLKEKYNEQVQTQKIPLFTFLKGKKGKYEFRWKKEDFNINYIVNTTTDTETESNEIPFNDHLKAPYRLSVEATDYRLLLQLMGGLATSL